MNITFLCLPATQAAFPYSLQLLNVPHALPISALLLISLPAFLSTISRVIQTSPRSLFLFPQSLFVTIRCRTRCLVFS